MTRAFLVLAFGWFYSLQASAQNKNQILTHEQLLDVVARYHPVSAQARLQVQKGASSVRQARGGFDPILFGDYDQKQFAGKNYYSLLQTGFVIPTWYGVELKAGYDYNTGQYLGSENVLPPNGLIYGGVKLSLAQGLFIDRRRTDLRQAQIYNQATRFEQQRLLNQLFFDASKQYWKWMEAWNQFRVYEEGLRLAKERLNGVKQSFLLGDRPAIDTLETFLQVQNMDLSRYQSLLDYRSTTFDLSNFLWYENQVPLEISDSLHPPSFESWIVPGPPGADSVQNWIAQMRQSHPDLQLYRNKLQSLGMERRLKAEYLKPKINLGYNLLSEPVNATEYTGMSLNNYKWGFDVRFPLLLRRERGDLELARIKIRETEYDYQQKQLELETKLRTYATEVQLLTNQITLFRNMVANYSRMLEGERINFNTGESSIFLVNTREMSLIQARLKLIELASKYQISSYGIRYATGSFYPPTLE